MSEQKREPLQKWWDSSETAPKTTVVKSDGRWWVVEKGSWGTHTDCSTWGEAIKEAMR